LARLKTTEFLAAQKQYDERKKVFEIQLPFFPAMPHVSLSINHQPIHLQGSSGAPNDGFLLNICSEMSKLPRNFSADD